MGDERTAWRPFLELWSQEWVAGHDPECDAPLAEEVVRDTWLGFAAAAEAQVAAAEARLGRRLPPSLREFLLVTDGWRDAGNFIYRLAGTEELAWLRDTDERTWIEVYQDIAGDDAEEEPGAREEEPYGEEFDDDEPEPYGVREARVLARSLRLSLDGDAAVMLLDPGDVNEDGEWAGYWLASWSGEGLQRHDSFHDLMRAQWRSFHALRRPPGPTRDRWDTEVEQARRAILAGEVDGPLAVLAEAHEFGHQRADVLHMQMKALLGDWQRGVSDLVWHRPHQADALLGPLFTAELLPLLIRQDQLVERHGLRPLARLKEHAPQAVRDLIADYEARSAAPGFRLSFGPPDFDAAVHAVASRSAT
ncbi:SMI1/KNR4 family protein, partial [Actinacidiphila rubida]|uniref:SMI1/KNR4 family protein n=1 Tax=Actinacidiphila rubida TaxID=310780 RepID=UPI00114CE328